MYLEILFQILLPVIGATAICLYFVSRGKFNMELAPLVPLLAFIITASFYFIPLFNYGVLGMKDYMYIKNNLSEAKFQEFKKTSKELEYLGVKMMLARQIIDNIDVSSSIYCKEIAKILIEYYKFSSDLKEYQIKDIRKKEKICKVNFRNIKNSKNEEIIYEIDLYGLWDEYVCSNYLELEKEVEENKDGLTSKLYMALYKAIILEKEEYYPNLIVEIENSIKSEKLKKWFQEEENGEKV